MTYTNIYKQQNYKLSIHMFQRQIATLSEIYDVIIQRFQAIAMVWIISSGFLGYYPAYCVQRPTFRKTCWFYLLGRWRWNQQVFRNVVIQKTSQIITQTTIIITSVSHVLKFRVLLYSCLPESDDLWLKHGGAIVFTNNL